MFLHTMGISVTVNAGAEPLTAELFFPFGLVAGGTVDLTISPSHSEKEDEAKRPFSLTHALVGGRKVPIARNNFEHTYKSSYLQKGLQVRSPLLNGLRVCQVRNVRRGSFERESKPLVTEQTSTADAARTAVRAGSRDSEMVIAESPDECKKALDDIIKAGEPATKTVFVCTECSHRTSDKEEAVEHCKSHLTSIVPSPVSNTAASNLPRRGRPRKYRFSCSTCPRSFPSQESLETHRRSHTSQSGNAVPANSARKDIVVDILRSDKPVNISGSVIVGNNGGSSHTSLPHLPQETLDEVVEPQLHDVNISAANSFFCLGCTKDFASAVELNSHRQSAHPGTHFCHICGEVFSEAHRLELHVTEAHGKGVCFYCTLCMAVFISEDVFNSHKASCGVACATSKRKRQEFICSHCSFITDTYANVCDHVAEKHPTVPLHRCSHCQRPFLHAAMCAHHVETVHSTSSSLEDKEVSKEGVCKKKNGNAACLYPCTFCDRVFKSLQGIQAHTNMHKNLRPYECRKCGASLSSIGNLRAHMVSIHGNPGDNAKCPHCPKVFKLKRSLNIHVRAVHGQKDRRQCDLCGKLLATEKKLQLHLALTHFGDVAGSEGRTFPLLAVHRCSDCNFKTFSYPRLKRHRVTHTGVYPHQCPECGKQFVFRDHLTRHVQSVHRRARLACPDCPRTFFSDRHYQHHLDTHRLAQGFPCMICNNFYETKAALEHHSQSHSESLPFECDLCKQRFKFSQGLSVHRRFQHRREGKSLWQNGDHTWRHSCDVCRIRFKYHSSLAAHRLSRHVDTERLTCTYCSRRFHSQGVLALHLRSHTAEKPHVCPHCGRAFSIPHNLKNHVVTQHTKEFKLFCPLCAKGVVSQLKLRQHLLQSHKATNSHRSPAASAAKSRWTAGLPEIIEDLAIAQVAIDDPASIFSEIIM